MTTISIPTRTELVRRASEIIPTLQEHASWNEQHRRIHDESLQALERIGVFRLRMPKRYGGYEADMRTMVEVLAELGQGDGSTAWVAWVLASNTWLLGLFPDTVQNEVFANPNVRVSGTLAPTGKVERRDGGFVLSGQWHFHSGSLHSQWSLVAAMSTTPEGGLAPVAVLTPTKELEVIDDWDTAGLSGTGSVSSRAKEIFVPAEHVISVISFTRNAIEASGVFAVNILRESQSEVARKFATSRSDKFTGLSVSYGDLGVPLLGNMLATIECRVVESVSGGTHTVFLAEVEAAQAREGMPLTYFRGRMGHFAFMSSEKEASLWKDMQWEDAA